MSTDGNGRYCYLNPRRGAMLALAEAARNVACAGALPIGGTNCLNFGNPERPEIMWQFVEAVEGLADACRALDIPITGGNVSLYNETDGQAIYPTPIIGVVGLIEDADARRVANLQAGRRRGRPARRGLRRARRQRVPEDRSRSRPGPAAGAEPRQGARAHRAADAGGGGQAFSSRRTTAPMAASRSRWPSALSTQAGSDCQVDLPLVDERRGDALRRVGVARGRVGDGREPAAAAAVGGRARRACAIDWAHRRRRGW